MKHIKQRKNECFITVLAMLSDTDVNKIIADAQIITPTQHSWSDYLSSSAPKPDDDAHMVFRALARKYAPYLVDHCGPASVKEVAEKKLYLTCAEFERKTARGKGAVIMVSRFLSRPGAHIAAYENGLIYCSDQDGPMTAREYYKFLATQTILCPFAVIPEF